MPVAIRLMRYDGVFPYTGFEGVPFTKKFQSIQILRALAAIGVVAYHVSGNVGGAGWAHRWFHTLALYGVMGVDVFFVVSGFVMALVTTDLPPSLSSAAFFMRARIARVVPMYWAMTALFVALVLLVPTALVFEPLSLSKAVTSFLFIPHLNEVGKVEPVLYVGWTLYYEMWFYFVFAAALLISKRPVLVVTTFLVAASLASFWGPQGALLTTYTNPIVLEFVAGAWLGVLYARGNKVSVWVAIVMVAVALGSHQLIKPMLTDANRFWVFGVPALAFVALCLSLERHVRSGTLTALGNASYSIYLTHVFSVPIGIRLLMFLGAGRRLQGDLACGAVVLVTLAIGVAAYRWIEIPLTRLAKKVRSGAILSRQGRAAEGKGSSGMP